MRSLGIALVVSAIVAVICRWPAARDGETVPIRWTMLPTNQGTQQADAHLLSLEPQETWLIDAGAEDSQVAAQLKSRGIERIGTVLISHPHKDHYGGLIAVLEGGIRVDRLVMHVPDRALCDRERPWGCDFEHVGKVRELARRRGTALVDVRAGDVLYRKGDVVVEVLEAHDGVSPPVGATDVNDLSLIVRLTNGATSALFTGDLNHKLGAYLASHGSEKLRTTLLKVPHHGAEGVAPDEFFQRVSPAAALVPAPATLWWSERSARVRGFFSRRGIPTYVSGVHGEVRVTMLPSGFRIDAANGFGMEWEKKEPEGVRPPAPHSARIEN